MTYKTPGVYVKEVSLFPPSIAEVETAIPAFIGYTEKAEQKGESLTNKPTKISSLLEYQELFGGPYQITNVTVELDETNNYAVRSIEIPKRFYLFDCLRLFFDNGGGKCYIVSVGSYADTIGSSHFVAGLNALKKYDEPTIILFPDATLLTVSDEGSFYSLQQQALAQCARLQDRVAVLDLFEGDPGRDLDTSVQAFRDSIGINNLKYGGAYTPWIYSSYPQSVPFSLFCDTEVDGAKLDNLEVDSDLNTLATAAIAAARDPLTIEAKIDSIRGTYPAVLDRYQALWASATNKAKFTDLLELFRDTANGLAELTTLLEGVNLNQDCAAYVTSTLKPAIEELVALEKSDDVRSLSGLNTENVVSEKYSAVDDSGILSTSSVEKSNGYWEDESLKIGEKIALVLPYLESIFQGSETGGLIGFIDQIREAAATHVEMADAALFQGHPIISNIAEKIKREMSRVPPSAAIAGVYAAVDDSRGVWKAPANVSLSSVLGPSVVIDDADQEDLNVDVNAGKSINAIRSFSGRGTLVWGARTLAGNDNEWRYVAVRRFFNMVEESVKKSTSWAVFEANAAPLWTRVRSMIKSYLNRKWREGALAGATPEEAFFVKVGLGQTMTADDILEGRLIVEIGMAVVRPAEFIILKFSHKMQES
jgi:phage tail sheath protein FI